MSDVKRSKPETLTLYSYWRSSCSWRVRIALAVKGVDYKYEGVNLLKGEQKAEGYTNDKNVMKQVPALDVGDDGVVGQSLAIMEYIEEVYPGPSLLPSSPLDKAKVRELCQIIACGIQPIQNLAVIAKIGADFGDEHKPKWANHWITQGFESLEKALIKYVFTVLSPQATIFFIHKNKTEKESANFTFYLLTHTFILFVCNR